MPATANGKLEFFPAAPRVVLSYSLCWWYSHTHTHCAAQSQTILSYSTKAEWLANVWFAGGKSCLISVFSLCSLSLLLRKGRVQQKIVVLFVNARLWCLDWSCCSWTWDFLESLLGWHWYSFSCVEKLLLWSSFYATCMLNMFISLFINLIWENLYLENGFSDNMVSSGKYLVRNIR